MAKLQRHGLTLYLDLETEGLATQFWEKAWGNVDPNYRRRARVAPPRITEVSLRGGPHSVFGFTDIVNKQMLDRHKVTSKQLRDINAALPMGLLRELVGTTGEAKFDPSVAIPGSVLNLGLRRHARMALRGRVKPTQTLIDSVVTNLEKASATQPVTLRGWNITGFDLPVLFGNSTPQQAARLSSLIRSGAVNVQEAASQYHRSVFGKLLKGDMIPMIADHAALNAAKGAKILNSQQAAQFMKRHTGLQNFISDIRGGKPALQKRAEQWATKFVGTRHEADAKKIASKVARRLGKVSNFDSYISLVRRAQLAGDTRMGGWASSFHQVVGEMYADPSTRHAHVLGDLGRVRGDLRMANKTVAKLSRGTMAGRVHALQFIMGGRQEDVVHSMVVALNKTAPDDPRLPQLSRALKGAHASAKDTRALEILGELMQPKPENQKVLQAFEAEHFDPRRLTAVYTKRVQQISEDFHTLEKVNEIFNGPSGGTKQAARVPGTNAAYRRAVLAGKKIKRFFAPRGATTEQIVGRMGLAAAGMYLLYSALGPKQNRENDEAEEIHKKRIEGIRRPRSAYSAIGGINPSDMDYANVSNFHSGANVWEGMMTASYLGKRWHNPFAGPQTTDPELQAMAEMGDAVHSYWQSKLLEQGVIQSAETPVWGFGMSGVVDTFLTGGIPMEIKTVGTVEQLARLSRPREKDIGQTNFDISASSANHGYIMYAAREDPLKVKMFRVLPDPIRLTRDIELMRAQMAADPRIQEGSLLNFEDPSLSYLHRKMLGGHAAVWRRSDPFEIASFFFNNLANTSLGINTAPEITGEDPFGGMDMDTVSAGSYNLSPELPPEYSAPDPIGLSNSSSLSKVRDHKTQLHRLPGLPRTYRRPNYRANMSSVTEF